MKFRVILEVHVAQNFQKTGTAAVERSFVTGKMRAGLTMQVRAMSHSTLYTGIWCCRGLLSDSNPA
jgi:hypothetical protein